MNPSIYRRPSIRREVAARGLHLLRLRVRLRLLLMRRRQGGAAGSLARPGALTLGIASPSHAYASRRSRRIERRPPDRLNGFSGPAPIPRGELLGPQTNGPE